MKTIRRLYFYLTALISMEVVVWGVIGLLRSIFNANKLVGGTSTLAQALSLILVGIPIFLVHWLWAQNASAKDDEEKTASVRAIFLYGILLGTLVPAVQNLMALVDRIFLTAANLYASRAIFGSSQTWVDNLIAIVINLLIAVYFLSILKNEWSVLPETENFAEIRRLYRFVWLIYGLAMMIFGAQQALGYAFTLSTNEVLGSIGRETVVNAMALLLIGTPIWFFAWRTLQDALSDANRAEKESYLRLGILYLFSLGGVVVVLSAGGSLIYMILMRIFGDGKNFADFIQDIGGPISLGVPFGVIWAYYGKWLNQQFLFDEDAPRRAGKQRLYFYILSFIGLVATFFAIVSLLSVVVDQITAKSYLSGFSSPLAGALSALVVGLPLWLMAWRPAQADALADGAVGDHARRSVIRKVYLYLVLFSSVIGGMISGGALIFTIINAMLGGNNTNFVQSALNSLQILILFIVLLLYHLSALRKDGAARMDMLEAKQEAFQLLILDNGSGKFGEAVKSAFIKRAPKISVTILNVKDEIPSELKADAVVLPGSLIINALGNISVWINSFNGSKFIVPDEAAGVYWLNDLGQVAESARAMAEGQEVRPQSVTRATSAWVYVAYVFAALFACQVLFMLIAFVVSLVTGF